MGDSHGSIYHSCTKKPLRHFCQYSLVFMWKERQKCSTLTGSGFPHHPLHQPTAQVSDMPKDVSPVLPTSGGDRSCHSLCSLPNYPHKHQKPKKKWVYLTMSSKFHWECKHHNPSLGLNVSPRMEPLLGVIPSVNPRALMGNIKVLRWKHKSEFEH